MELSKNYTPSLIEEKWNRHWFEKKYFNSTPDNRKAFTVVIPPPNVTGVELRLQRHGNTFSAWMRQPNSDWQHINDSQIPFRTNVMIGLLVVNTENAGSPITATFSNFQMSCQ